MFYRERQSGVEKSGKNILILIIKDTYDILSFNTKTKVLLKRTQADFENPTKIQYETVDEIYRIFKNCIK